ncbi:hypothetical protein [Bacillus licheniformis]|uniref:hypothetical protein n=2 Tax=Bacillus licheniformis TaxID=1402 RepID=UPI001323F15E|nr:hypothetical protein [Bacillus licheniformis]MDE1403245.1 hypothetical protein [Bacillus licheniformis]TWL51375.1 hypothetical protein CHCC15335_3071 [Bacillus licheniformis]TWL74979.1 hypothetical protein CHCC15315_1918 [Bacillus licheniformis]
MEFSEIVKHQLTTTGLRKLTKFIRKEFPAKGQPHSEQMKKYEALKKLSHNDLSSGIARMVRIESSFDHSKFAAIFVLIIGSLLGAVKFMLIDNPQPLGGEVYFTFTMFAASLLLIAVVLDKRDMTTASYFKELLEQAKADKGNEKENEKDNPISQVRPNNRIEVKISKLLPLWKKKNFYIKEAQNLEEILLNWPDKELAKYVSDYFGYWSTKNKKVELKRIRDLDLDTIILSIARMKDLEEYSDNSKIVPGFTSLLTFFVTHFVVYVAYQDKDNGDPTFMSVNVGILFSALAFAIASWFMSDGRTQRARAAHYRSLLEQVKSEMEKAS